MDNPDNPSAGRYRTFWISTIFPSWGYRVRMTSEWPTEAEAAALLGVSVKTIARYAEKNLIETRKRPRLGKKPENVCNPSDIEKLKPAARAIVEAAYFEPSASLPPVQNPSGFASVAPALGALIQTISKALELVQIERGTAKLWLTIAEAAAYSGRSKGWLLQACREGRLGAEKDRGWKIRRASLEAL